jgi:hypothetical protein
VYNVFGLDSVASKAKRLSEHDMLVTKKEPGYIFYSEYDLHYLSMKSQCNGRKCQGCKPESSYSSELPPKDFEKPFLANSYSHSRRYRVLLLKSVATDEAQFPSQPSLGMVRTQYHLE